MKDLTLAQYNQISGSIQATIDETYNLGCPALLVIPALDETEPETIRAKFAEQRANLSHDTVEFSNSETGENVKLDEPFTLDDEGDQFMIKSEDVDLEAVRLHLLLREADWVLDQYKPSKDK